MGNFSEADLQKAYDRAQDKYNETATIESRSRQVERKLEACTKIASPSGLNIAPAKYPSITSVISQESAEDDDASLLGGASLALYPEGHNISLLVDEASLTGGDVYPSED